jgi:hypothetical protein
MDRYRLEVVGPADRPTLTAMGCFVEIIAYAGRAFEHADIAWQHRREGGVHPTPLGDYVAVPLLRCSIRSEVAHSGRFLPMN